MSAPKPPVGVIGYLVVSSDGKHSLHLARNDAETYAVKAHGVVWPLVCGRRFDDRIHLLRK